MFNYEKGTDKELQRMNNIKIIELQMEVLKRMYELEELNKEDYVKEMRDTYNLLNRL